MTDILVSTAASDAARVRREITDDLDLLLEALPEEMCARLRESPHAGLLEVILDLGRRPEARFMHGAEELLEREVTDADIAHVIEHIGVFGDDNRAGIERTLHRISAIRNRSGKVVGLTLRIGRAVFGTIDIIRDIVNSGQSILILGRPGVGKTTMLREVARVLADDLGKRVVVVDTSNEIAGDGDIPHPGIGDARRMQVRTPTEQHAVMIEAVENHMPEVIIIDEIGTELEAGAARTIAERGVQLVGTAHGNTLENLMLNPTLSDLVGGIQPVTLGDEEARHRGTQKTVLERQAPPTFDVLVEIVERDHVVVHRNVAETVDVLLRGNIPTPESRWRDGQGQLHQETNYSYRVDANLGPSPATTETGNGFGAMGAQYRRPTRARSRQDKSQQGMNWNQTRGGRREVLQPLPGEKIGNSRFEPGESPLVRMGNGSSGRGLQVFPFGISSKRVEQAARELGLPVTIAREIEDADAVMTLSNHYKRRPTVLREAEINQIPVYVLRSNSIMQVEKLLTDIFGLEVNPQEAALQEAAEAIGLVRTSGYSQQLTPQNAYIRRLQHQLAERESLMSRSRGHEPQRRVEVLAP